MRLLAALHVLVLQELFAILLSSVTFRSGVCEDLSTPSALLDTTTNKWGKQETYEHFREEISWWSRKYRKRGTSRAVDNTYEDNTSASPINCSGSSCYFVRKVILTLRSIQHGGGNTDSSRPSLCTHFYAAFRHQHTSRQPRKQKTIYWFKNAAPAGESSRPRIKQKHIDLNSSTLITRRIHTTHKQAGNTLSSPLPLRRIADGYYCAHPYQLISHTSCHSTERFITVITKRKDNHTANNHIYFTSP